MPDLRYYMHVNYLEGVFPLEEICDRCAQAGYDGIELRGHDRSGQLPIDQYLNRAYKAATSSNLGLVLGCRFNTTSSDTRERTQAMAYAKTVIDFAGDHSLPTLNTFGGSILPPEAPVAAFDQTGSNVASEDHWQWTTEMLAEAGEHAKTKGVTLCLEMHNGYIHDLAQPTARLLDRIDNDHVLANFDAGNIILHPDQQGLAEEVNQIKDRTGYVHLKNMISFLKFGSRIFHPTPLRDGAINHFTLLRNLLDTYSGILTIENTMSGDKRPLMKEDLDYLKSVVHDLG